MLSTLHLYSSATSLPEYYSLLSALQCKPVTKEHKHVSNIHVARSQDIDRQADTCLTASFIGQPG